MAKVHQVQVFVGPNAQGNPAGVMLLKDEILSDSEMSRIAKAVGHPETAFINTLGEGPFPIRYFSQSGAEVPFCGHATVGTAATLKRFHFTGSYKFKTTENLEPIVNFEDDWYILSRPTMHNSTDNSPELCDKIEALGLASHLGYSLSAGGDLLVNVPSADFIRNFTPNVALIEKTGLNRLVILAPDNVPSDEYPGDVVLRYFASGLGIPEDPATGSVALLVAEWLKPVGEKTIYQASPQGGHLRIRYSPERVEVRGQCKFLEDLDV